MTKDQMMELRRSYAIQNNTSRFVINAIKPSDNTYSKNKDKDGLRKADRAKVEAAKDKMTYPDEIDLW